MRAFTFLLALGLVGSAFAAPTPIAQPNSVLFAKDPLSIHRRSAIPLSSPELGQEIDDIESPADVVAVVATADETASVAPVVAVVADEPTEDSCMAVCGVQRVEGAKSEREALCSVNGLQATLSCAQCIDTTWPDTTWEDSAMAEYERIVSACQDTSQRTFRRSL